ncbi:hypothetical protein NQ318_021517 [Aromia moschata]|uniref:Uncharacterized protein n=1 Tax=Aromia moschata TaxID=1265417 RepID=A0AAV8ZC69_9CUCU|nr:hypothetical protein NQ318_021517 [Aromia moschata]
MVRLALIMILTVGVGTSACPSTCTCRNYPRDNLQKTSSYYTAVTCDGYGENVTLSLDNATRDLQVSRLNQREVEDLLENLIGTGADLPYLTNLAVTKSEIGNVNVSADSLERILSLTLSDNRLQILPVAFLNSPDLQSLDLSLNEVRAIDLEPFRTLRSLEVLNLSANSLASMDAGSFSGLNGLKCLDLSRNNLSAIRDRVLAPLTSLQYLNLSNNRLEVLEEACFGSLAMLQQLDVSWNRLARVAPGTLHLPSLARLLLAGNPQLGRARDAAVLVGTGRRLQTVDASRTGLKQVPAALTHSIRTLRLAGNSIRTVSCGDLDSYPLLQLLDLGANGLQAVEEDALGRLDSLAVLYLADNKIRDIPKSLPERLEVLHLERNNVERVSSRDLQGLAALQVLSLSDNKIRIVDEAAFSHLVSLVTLDLSRNPVAVLHPGCLQGPAALEVLRLASIRIISPAAEVSFPLSAPEHLVTLDLSDSPGLARQLLADTAALAASRELQELDLSRAGLETIRSDLLHYLPQLRVLHIAGNRLNCSQLEWLAAWLRRQDEPEYRDVICAAPPDLWGTPLVDLQDDEVSPMRTINHPGGASAINLDRGENDTNALPASGNFTRQYTTDSTNYASLTQDDIRNVTNVTFLLDSSANHTKNNSKESADLTNEIEKSGKGRILNRGAISAVHLTTIFGVSNDPVSTPQHAVDETTAAATHPNPRDIIDEPDKAGINGTRKPKNANEPGDSPGDKTPAIGPTDESNATKSYRDVEGQIDSEVTDMPQQWNASTGEMSMYTNNREPSRFLHPGMLILAGGG